MDLPRETNHSNVSDLGLVSAYPVLFPERMPPFFKEDDNRFAIRQKSERGEVCRSYACDASGCKGIYSFNTQALPFDGQYMNKTWTKVSPTDLKQLWREKRIDATWHCTHCHKRKRSDSVSLHGLRVELGMYRIEHRQKRTLFCNV